MTQDPFVWERRVAFGECDPAGIAYTGRIADYALEAIDVFWEDLLNGESWYRMLTQGRFGIPFVRMEFEFSAPVMPDLRLFSTVEPTAIGTTSVRLRVTGRQDGHVCFMGKFVSVFADLSKGGALGKMAVPERIRAALEPRIVPEG